VDAERSSDGGSLDDAVLAVDTDATGWSDWLPDDLAVVGLGESTHGTHEFWAIRRRLLRHLVRERGLRAVGLELPFSQALPLGEYVLTGTGDPRAVLDEIHYWMYSVEPVLSLVEWLRQFNAGRPVDDRVRLHGIDVGSERGTDAAAIDLRATLADVLPRVEREFAETLEMLADAGLSVDDRDVFWRRLTKTWRLTTALKDRLHERRPEFISALSRRHWEITVHQVRTLRHVANALEAARDPDRRGLRDQYMAENVAWLHERSRSPLVAFLAHNGHVMRTNRPAAGLSMGHTLHRRYGDGYYGVALEFGTGSFTAVSPSGRRTTFCADTPVDDSLAATLSEVSASQFFLDIRSPPTGAGFDDVRYLRQIGSRFDPEWNWEQYHCTVVPERAADGIVYVPDGSPVRHLDDG
jgi:erythromycin esterase